MTDTRGFTTRSVHTSHKSQNFFGSISIPIITSSTYALDQDLEPLGTELVESHGIGFEYGRASNYTRGVTELTIANLEKCRYGMLFSSGLAAIQNCLLALLAPGDKILMISDVYGGVYRLVTKIIQKFGILMELLSPDEISDNLDVHLDDSVRALYVESITNPCLNIIDYDKIKTLLRSRNIMLIVDNTFGTPYCINPIDFGADIVIHSASKFLGGHSDIIAGFSGTNNLEIAKKLYYHQNAIGSILSPFDSYLLSRSLYTLELRMQRQVENATNLASHLYLSCKFALVLHPSLPNYKYKDLAAKYLRAPGSMISVVLKSEKDRDIFLKNTTLFKRAVSLGGVESLIQCPSLQTHATYPPELQEKVGITSNLIRLSIGIENFVDILADINYVLNII